MRRNRVYARVLFTVACLLFSAVCVRADDWKPVDPAHLALKAPVVEPDADAEAIFWDVRVDDQGEDLIFTNYIRIKVFTQRGKEMQSQIDIPYRGTNRVSDIRSE